jgi:hypothetical protein
MKRLELLYKPGWVWDVLPSVRVHWRPAPAPWSVEMGWFCVALYVNFRLPKVEDR